MVYWNFQIYHRPKTLKRKVLGMQISVETIISLSGVLTSFLTGGVVYGVMREKVYQLEIKLGDAVKESKEDRRDIREEMKTFVTHGHLEAVIEPIKDTLDMLQSDVKEILKAVSH